MIWLYQLGSFSKDGRKRRRPLSKTRTLDDAIASCNLISRPLVSNSKQIRRMSVWICF